MTTPTRCAWSDLPTNTCSHCTGVGPTIGRINPRPPAPQYPAGYTPSWTPVDDKKPTPRDWHDGDKAPTKSTRCKHVANHPVFGDVYLLPEHHAACTNRDCNGCKPCTHDDHRNPVTHCQATASCSEHLDHTHPHTCPRCIARVRATLAHIERLTALTLDQATIDGLNSTAAMLAGPAANPETNQRRGILIAQATRGITDPHHPATRAYAAWNDDNLDETHPAWVCIDWEHLIREHYKHPAPRFTANDVRDPRLIGEELPPTLSRAISYLSWVLTDLAQDPTQDFAALANELSDCKSHLETALGASRAPERGAPCPACPSTDTTPKPRLQRRRAHWCEKPDCTREHDKTGARDTWVCPNNPDHWWAEADYRRVTYEDAVAEGYQPRRAGGNRS